MEMGNMLILADIEDIVRALVPIIFVLFWVVSQIWSAVKDKPGKAKAPQRPKPARAAPPVQRREPNDINGEIEEFLRRTGEKRGGDDRQAEQQRAGKRPPKERKRREPQLVDEAKREELRRQSQKARTLVATAAPVLAPEPLDADRGSHLKPVDQADEAMEAHLAQVFDHSLGSLKRSAPLQASDASGTPAAKGDRPLVAPVGLAAMLANPQSLKTAVVLNEIFQRPEHRW